MKLTKNLVFIIILILLNTLIYANTFRNDFVFDDPGFIVNNYEIRDLKNIPSFFTEPTIGSLYRPLRTTWYSIIYQISGQDTWGYHLNSLIFHVLVTILFYFITLKVTEKKNLSFIIALLFAAHPIHTGRVTNMTAGFDILGIFLMLLSFYFYIIFSKDKKKNFLYYSVIAFILALLGTEEAITLPLLILLYEFIFGQKTDMIKIKNVYNNIRWFGSYVVIFLAYFIIRTLIIEKIGRSAVYYAGSFSVSVYTTFTVFIRYIRLLFLPLNLNVEYIHDLQYSLFEWKAFVSLLIIIALLVFAFYIRKRSKFISFGIFWFFITLIPFSNIFPVNVIMAERYLYVPSFGFCLILGFVFYKLINFKSGSPNVNKTVKAVSMLALVILLLWYSSVVIQRNSEWRDSISFWEITIGKEPRASRPYDNLGIEYLDMGNHADAIDYFLIAIDHNPLNHIAYANLGRAYAEIGEFDKAKSSLIKSIEIHPDIYNAYNNLGIVYDMEGNFSLAIDSFEKAISLSPKLHKAHMDLAKTLVKKGEFTRAEEEFKLAVELRPELPDPHYNLGIFYEFINQTGNAKDEFKIAYEIEPENDLYINRYKRYFS
ncbi:MAG: tetratricopeptide repeat protein [Candidatus Woesearchaeota archaeon]